ncbi:hypothetical protein [Mangrovibrevibacter kandeliae]|uniref:hypothetical protein n=1 Tax=Mangrovibrevibacter kandeliae TaxID=2968473 RepID=UPI0021181510|nr:hypothetical protein [Aurantimonas sp. CSK15Z-1]MCQ8782300.1 hypothetical protein [Aurantimonas sp. CSK15Z-1]
MAEPLRMKFEHAEWLPWVWFFLASVLFVAAYVLWAVPIGIDPRLYSRKAALLMGLPPWMRGVLLASAGGNTVYGGLHFMWLRRLDTHLVADASGVSVAHNFRWIRFAWTDLVAAVPAQLYKWFLARLTLDNRPQWFGHGGQRRFTIRFGRSYRAEQQRDKFLACVRTWRPDIAIGERREWWKL